MPTMLASAGEDVRLWTMPDLSLHSVKNGSNANVTSCACSSNGQLVAYAHEEHGLNVANILDGLQPIVHIPTGCEQSSVVFNGNSRYLASGGVDHVVNIWDIKSRTVKRSYKIHEHPVTCCIFNHNDNIITSASDHGEILLTNVSSGHTSESLIGPDTQAIHQIQYSFFARSLLGSTSDSGVLNLWDTKTKQLLKTFNGHKAPVTGLSFSPLNDMLVCSSGLDKRIIFYDVLGKKTVKTINTESPLTCCEFMNDGCTVAVGSVSGRIYSFDLRQGSTPIKMIPGHKTSVRAVSFQKIPKENKSPRCPADESSSNALSSSNQSDPENDTVHNTVKQETKPVVQREKSASALHEYSLTLSRQRVNNLSLEQQDTVTSTLPRQRDYNDSFMVRRENSTPNLLGNRENSSAALKNVLNANKPVESVAAHSAVPRKALKLLGDDVFSPIGSDPSITGTKKPLNRFKSAPKKDSRPQSVSTETDEYLRPSYTRSKSSLSKFNIMARSTDDLHTTKKGKDNDSNDGGKKIGLLGFKSPFKKKQAPNKHSDDSETSSIDSFSLEDKKRGKMYRSSDRSVDSGHLNMDTISGKLSNGSGGRLSPFGFNSQVDTSQIITDIQNSLGVNNDGSIHSAEFTHVYPNDVTQYKNTPSDVVNQPVPFQIGFIQKMIEDSMEENRDAVHDDMIKLQVEMIRQMEIQKEQIRQMLDHYSINNELVLEIDRLRAENEKLRTKY